MGIGAIAKPSFVTAQFGILELTLAGSNEVRAVTHEHPMAIESNTPSTMNHVITIALLVAGIIHLLPVSGVLGPSALARLYDIEVNDPNMAILLQHRALLFGVLGMLTLIAIPLAWLRLTALTVALFSALSFIVIATMVNGYNPAIARIVIADVVASVLLATGLAAELYLMSRKTT